MKLTRDEIMAMQAGPEMDAAIQRDVFGFEIRMLRTYYSGDDGSRFVTFNDDGELYPCYLPKYEHDASDDDFCEPVPEYSTDIAAAFEVVAHLKPDRVRFHYYRPLKKDAVGCWLEFAGEGEISSLGDSEAHALCRAALLATLERKP